jgi:phage terminase large subunit-like protein
MNESSSLGNAREGGKGAAGKIDTAAAPLMSDPPDFGVEGGRRSGFTKESRWWDIYNNEAEKVDQELIKDWRESLNGLLLFVSRGSKRIAGFRFSQFLGGYLCRRSHSFHHRE